MKIKYVGDNNEYDCSVIVRAKNLIEVETKSVPRKTGFVLIIGDKEFNYKDFKTIYRTLPNSVIYSNDGSHYVEPEPKEPEIEEITLEERVSDIEDALIEIFEMMEGE